MKNTEQGYQIDLSELGGALEAFFGGWLSSCALFAAFDTERRFMSDRYLKATAVIGSIGAFVGDILHDKGTDIVISIHGD